MNRYEEDGLEELGWLMAMLFPIGILHSIYLWFR